MISSRVLLPFSFNKRKTITTVMCLNSKYTHPASFTISCNRDSHGNVANFYAGKSVFITGGTGFLGKVFIEKLLYSCADIEKIYVLIRETEQLSALERLNNLIHSPVFSRIRQEKPKQLKKIISIAGDITEPHLGISSNDTELLKDKVAVVIHSAATIKFNQPLKEALKINYEGTKKVLDLCKKLRNIQIFVHISTAYAHCDKEIIEEQIYPPHADIKHVYKELKRLSHEEEKILKLLNGKPNTYVFTKELTETFIAEEHKNIPTIIIRPSMVGPSVDEPIKGWLDTMSLPSSYLAAAAIGLNHVIRGRRSNIVDFVPVDYVANVTIVAASKYLGSDKLAVYNCATGYTNPIYLDETFNFFNQARIKFSSNDFSSPKVFIVNSKLGRDVLTLLTQIIPGHLFDMLLILNGNKPRCAKQQKKFIQIRNSYEYFTLNSFIIKTDKLQEMYKNMSELDRRIFPFNFSKINWVDYMVEYAKAVERFLILQKNLKD